jgi:hypothetical protein
MELARFIWRCSITRTLYRENEAEGKSGPPALR